MTTTANEVSPQVVAQRVLNMQDACNLTGVLADAEIVRQAVIDLTQDTTGGTFARNRHPLYVLFIYKCAALAGFEPLDFGLSETFAEAERQVRAIAADVQR